MALWQVVEKDDFGTDWAAVRYHTAALNRFETEEQALKAARDYVTDRNCNNALTRDEKLSGAEAFIMTDNGCFLGVLDNEEWFLTYPKDIKTAKVDVSKGDPVKDKSFYMLEGKTEVAVRKVPGT